MIPRREINAGVLVVIITVVWVLGIVLLAPSRPLPAHMGHVDNPHCFPTGTHHAFGFAMCPDGRMKDI